MGCSLDCPLSEAVDRQVDKRGLEQSVELRGSRKSTIDEFDHIRNILQQGLPVAQIEQACPSDCALTTPALYKEYFNNYCMLLLLGRALSISESCLNPVNAKCPPPEDPTRLHLAYHPHLDAFWIVNFDEYLLLNPKAASVLASNFGTPVGQLFATQIKIQDSIAEGKDYSRTFLFSEMCFFRAVYQQLPPQDKDKVGRIMAGGNWQVLNGGWVEADEACTYFQDLIENLQIGRRFLYRQFGFVPNVSISSDSFGHSYTLAYLNSLAGVSAAILERSDQHLVNEGHKLQYTWLLEDSYGNKFGLMPVHIRWAIHGHQQVYESSRCQVQARGAFSQIGRQCKYFKIIYDNQHVLRYFGHDFQKFGNNEYEAIQNLKAMFEGQPCLETTAAYSTASAYFYQLFLNNSAMTATRRQDIMPIWDYDSFLFWTGYYTTNPFFKKVVRDFGKSLQLFKKLVFHLGTNDKLQGLVSQFQEQNALQQHHDGITGTSKYEVHDFYFNKLTTLKQSAFQFVRKQYQPNALGHCLLDSDLLQCKQLPQVNKFQVKVFNPGFQIKDRRVRLKIGTRKLQVVGKASEVLCPCQHTTCDCFLLFKIDLNPGANLFQIETSSNQAFRPKQASKTYKNMAIGQSEITIGTVQLGYRIISGHWLQGKTGVWYSRFGDKFNKTMRTQSGKYATVNNPSTERSLSNISRVQVVTGKQWVLVEVEWKLPTLLTRIWGQLDGQQLSLERLQVQTFLSAKVDGLNDYYLSVRDIQIDSGKTFYTDSNGLLVAKRVMDHHEDYTSYVGNASEYFNSNTYPVTAFAFIKDQNSKLAVVVDRPQGAISPRSGTLLFAIDRVTADDGKWVYQTSWRVQYMRHVHVIMRQGKNHNKERDVQRQMDQVLYLAFSADQSVPEAKPVLFSRRLKYNVRRYQDQVLLRVASIDDLNNVTFELYKGNNCPALATINSGNFQFTQLVETDVSGSVPYKQMVKRKWKWEQRFADFNSSRMDIFSKVINETIILRPLQIRTFLLKLKGQTIKVENGETRYRGAGKNDIRVKRARFSDQNTEYFQVDDQPLLQFAEADKIQYSLRGE